MPNDAPEYDRPECWFRHADSDLAVAESSNGAILPEHKCFHAQQAAEKALKAVCVSRGVVFRFTHDIYDLIDILRDGGVDVPDSLEEADELSNYAVRTRYPGVPARKILEQDRKRAVALARAVLEWAKNQAARAGTDVN